MAPLPAFAEPEQVSVRTGDRSAKATVPATPAAPGYELDLASDPVRITTTKAGETVLATLGGGGLRYYAGGAWHHATTVTSTSSTDGELRFTAATTQAGRTVEGRIVLEPDRYTFTWSVSGDAEQLSLAYDLSSAGHWYGHGEIQGQPYPLETGQVRQEAHSPASYDMVEPFWYTSSATGLWVDTGKVMDVGINAGGDGAGRFTIKDGGAYKATVFVEQAPLEVYRDWIGVVGKPGKIDATYDQFAKPLWNSWAQFYTKVTQASMLDYAEGLHRNGVTGHTIQLDDKWESEYGNLTFDPSTFPDPKGLSDRIHAMGFDFGIWVTLWINLTSDRYQYAKDHGYLLKDGADPTKPCTVQWWNGQAGIIDLGNPAAKAWYEGNLRGLMKDYRVEGFKFDTAFFNDACKPAEGYQPRDYQRLGAEMADQFDLQGAGIRVHWAGPQKYGFVTRTVDQGTSWESMRTSLRQALTVSTLGYPFVETDMIGGSIMQPPPRKEVLVRWAQAAALTPLMYSSTSPIGAPDAKTGKWTYYDAETIAEYRRALAAHERLAPYLWDQAEAAVRTGDPIIRPVFFDFPTDERFYTVDDQWMLGPAVLAAPMTRAGSHRTIHLPAGRWIDVNHGTEIRGPATLTGYPVPIGVTPAFVRVGADGAQQAARALRRTDVAPGGVRFGEAEVSTDAGVPVTMTTHVTNWQKRSLTDVSVALKMPAGWTAEATTPAAFERVQQGQTATTTWRVTPSADARWAPTAVTARASYSGRAATDTATVTVAPGPSEIGGGYRTHSTAPDTQYGQSGDQLAIWAGGRDLSGWVDEKATVYRDGGSTVIVRVVDQEGGSPIAKAGIAVANDLTAPERGGYAVLVMTATGGLEFMWDADGNGKLDGWAGGGASFHPAWLKLTRDGTTYTAYSSTDGTDWRQVGQATVASASGAGHAGVVTSAVNLNYPGRITRAIFDNVTVTP
jgi:alpha-glucosidase (family GH31 glycosyl hydrolase)